MKNENRQVGAKREIEAGRVLGGYRMLRPLGGGGMGRVYEAEHERLGVRRAVKVFTDGTRHARERKALFLAEGRALAKLSHPRVVRIHDLAIDEASGSPYFSMDLVLSPDGEPRTLEEARCRGIDEECAAAWFADICEGLDYIHSQGVVHCDVKLENVLVGPDERAVISDFGISRVFGDAAPCDGPAGIAALCMGTYNYLAPELLDAGADAKPSPETDAWALGVMLFRLLTGFWFDDGNRRKCLALLDDFDLPWKGVVARLCSRDPAARLVGGRLVPFAVSVSPGRVHRRRAFRGAAVCAAFVALAAAAFVILWRGSVYERRPNAPELGTVPKPGTVPVAHFRLESPTWREFYRSIHDASCKVLLVPFDGMDAEVEAAIRDFVERQESYYSYESFWPQDRVDRMDSLVAAEMANAGTPRHANPAQLLVLAGEVYRQKKLWSFDQGEFPDDVDRLADLTKKLVMYSSDGQCDQGLAFELIEGSFPFDRLEGRHIGAKDALYQGSADPWLGKMVQASALAAEASRAYGSSVSPEDDREHDEKRALATRLFKEALKLRPDRYRAAERLVALAHDDVEEASRSFERCQGFCFDDLRAMNAYARAVLDLEDEKRERLALFLDQALETGRYDTWAPAFYVIGRWSILARYDREGRTLDDRSWAYEDEDVRRKTLETIRRYKDGEAMSAAPKTRRLVATAVFAASALACGDEELAAELARRIPPGEFNAILGSAMRTTSPTFRRLKELASASAQI